MWQLILKDVEQHTRALTLFFSSAAVVPAGFYLAHPTGADNSGVIGVTFGYMVFGAPTLFSLWLVGQEKMKGTLRLLKILPISGQRIIATKSLTAMTLCALVILIALVGAPLFLRVVGFPIELPSWPTVLWICMAAVFFVAINITIFTAFDHKIASQIAYFGFGFAMIALGFAERFLKPRGVNVYSMLTSVWQWWYFSYWGWILAPAFAALLILFAGRLCDQTEWPELEEG